jgi:aspartyl/asparaginyl beta-hydroxylase (cupin superfamily)
MAAVPKTFKNAALYQKRCRKLRALAQRIITGKVGVIEGSHQMGVHRQGLHAWNDANFAIFETVNRESIHLPVGKARSSWDAKALLAKDGEIARLEEAYRVKVVSASASLQKHYL